MKQTANGIEVAQGSRITIACLARNMGLNLAAFAPSADWGTLSSPIVITDHGLSRSGAFEAPMAPDRCDIVVEINFLPDAGGNFPAGIDYTISITETTPEGQATTIDDPPPIIPPPIVDRGYKFITR